MSYQGWKNYETWAVNLWISNEEPSYLYWNEQAETCWEEAEEIDDSFGKSATRSDRARYNLSETLKNEHEEMASEVLKEASLFSDLLTGALQSVDWHEIANSWLDEVEGYETVEEQRKQRVFFAQDAYEQIKDDAAEETVRP